MKKLYTLLAVLAIVLFPVNSYAWDPPASPKPASAISDQSGVLSDAAHKRLDAQLKQINANSANEIAVLILPSLNDEDISDVGIATAKSWGVGKKDLDNGVLIILAMKEHKSRIETGKGVEGDLPDLKCNDILAKVLRPYMKRGDVEGGLSATINSISSSIANHKSEVANGTQRSPSCQVSAPGSDDNSDTITTLLIIGLGLIGTVVLWRMIARKKKREEEEAHLRFEQELVEIERESQARLQNLERQREALARQRELMDALTPVVPVPIMPRPSVVATAKVESKPPTMKTSHIKPTVVATASTVTLATLEAERLRKEEREFARQQEENDRRRRQDEEDERRRRNSESSSSSSGSSFDWGGGSSGGGFGGGDFGGGGSSSSW